MAQITTGVRAVFSLPRIYDLAQNLIGAERARAILVREYVRPVAGQRLLDIGCGTAGILSHLPTATGYVGVDLSPDYIEAARRAYGDRGEFHCADMGRIDCASFRNFDVAVAMGLLHHLDDAEAHNMLASARDALVSGGRLITLDPCFDSRQPALARFTIARDRGRNVRTASQYADLARGFFSDVRMHVRNDMIRIPYTHAVLECRR